MTQGAEHWLALTLVEGVGHKTVHTLLRHFGSVEALLDADAETLRRAGALKPEVARRIAGAREVRAFHMEQRLVQQHGVHLLPVDAPDYPPLLHETAVPPALLYCKGALPDGERPHLAVVGTRRNTRYGEKVTRKLIAELAQATPELVIVSGLARGVDTAAHEQALESGLDTVAVMAGGLSRIYPPENEGLAERITQQGALVTEFPMAQAPLARNFPIRNRIIAGLCGGVLVVEAGDRSGALITAGFALNQGREVFAVPGNINVPSYRGTNRLIQSGQAKLVREAADIAEELRPYRKPRTVQMDWLQPEVATAPGAPDDEKAAVLHALSKGPLHADDLSDEAGIPVEKLLGLLLELELSGDIYLTGDNHYALA